MIYYILAYENRFSCRPVRVIENQSWVSANIINDARVYNASDDDTHARLIYIYSATSRRDIALSLSCCCCCCIADLESAISPSRAPMLHFLLMAFVFFLRGIINNCTIYFTARYTYFLRKIMLIRRGKKWEINFLNGFLKQLTKSRIRTD